jgi:hypothetical protein
MDTGSPEENASNRNHGASLLILAEAERLQMTMILDRIDPKS